MNVQSIICSSKDLSIGGIRYFGKTFNQVHVGGGHYFLPNSLFSRIDVIFRYLVILNLTISTSIVVTCLPQARAQIYLKNVGEHHKG